MSVEYQIRMFCQWNQQQVLVPTPPGWEELLRRARAETIPIGRLFVLNRSLRPGIRGSYQRDSQELWCVLDPSSQDGARQALMCLFVLFAHAMLHQPVPRTIDEDWEQERVAWIAATELAHRWRQEGLFLEEEVRARCEEIQVLRQRHWNAGLLAGDCHPTVARAAYRTLALLKQSQQWSDEQFDRALDGQVGDGVVAVVDFDRTTLRATWRMTARGEQTAPFGGLGFPQTEHSAMLLRRVLQRAALGAWSSLWSTQRAPCGKRGGSHFSLTVEDEHQLVQAIVIVNSWLIEEQPDHVLDGQWTVCGDLHGDHVYQLSVRYMPCSSVESSQVMVPPTLELQVLFPSDKRMPVLEAAWQRFISGWSKAMHVTAAHAFDEGIRLLWNVF